MSSYQVILASVFFHCLLGQENAVTNFRSPVSTPFCNPGQQNCSQVVEELMIVLNDTPAPICETEPKNTEVISERSFISSITDSLTSLEEVSQEVKDLVKSKEEIIQIIANKAEEAFKFRHILMKQCSCIPNRCSNVLGEDVVCGDILGNATKECAVQEGTRYSMDRGMTDLPQAGQIPTNLTNGVKASICLMNHLEKEVINLLKCKDLSSWTYLGTEQGVIYSYPGRHARRSDEIGLEQWNYCIPYDPRTRPWYHEGATGPLDIVLVVDVSLSMSDDNVIGSLTRWDIVQDALIKFVDTLTFTDYFNIVFFNFQSTSMVTGLLPGIAENRQKAKDFIANFSPDDGTNFEVAFESAFKAFFDGIEAQNSTLCNKVILFLTDGKDNKIDIDKNRTKNILNKVEDLQSKLESISNKRANIFSFSIGENADDSIPRQLACMHNGSWAPIAAQDDPLTVFNTYLRFIASARNTTRVYWSEIYEDAWGTGDLISGAMPVYIPQNNENFPGALFGVVGHDIRVSYLKELVEDRQLEQFFAILQEGSKQCDDIQINQCLQQVLRGEDVECADLSYQNAICTKFDNKYYKRSQTRSTWSDAKNSCQASGGELAVANSTAEQAFLAGAASFEGSWIGLSNNGFYWVWEDQQIPENQQNFWAYGQGDTTSNEIFCSTIAPSGTSKNFYSHACRFSFTYICEFENLPVECGDDFVDLDNPNYQYFMPRIENCSSAESLEQFRFFDTVELPEIKSKDLFCFDDFSQPSMPNNFFNDFICCEET